MTHNKFRIRVIAAVFITLLIFPFINSKLHLIKDIKSSENRQMTAKPNLNINRLDPFPALYEKFYNDHFTIRSILVKYYNLLNIDVFKKSPVPDQVVIGKDGWLFMAGNELDAYRGKNSFELSDLEAFKKELDFRVDYLGNRGCKLYLLIAPTKASVYNDYMPETVFRLNKQSWGEQLNDYLKKNSKVKIINVYDIFRTEKNKELLYYKLDNHWNQLGSFYAANEAFKQIGKDFPDVKPVLLDDFTVTKTDTTGGNIISMLSGTGNFSEFFVQVVPKSGFKAFEVQKVGYPPVKGFPYPWDYEFNKETKDSTKPRVLIISDSYGNGIFPFLAENFSRTVRIFDSWQYKLNEDIVNQEKPDIVLIIALESNIKNMLKYQSRLGMK